MQGDTFEGFSIRARFDMQEALSYKPLPGFGMIAGVARFIAMLEVANLFSHFLAHLRDGATALSGHNVTHLRQPLEIAA